MGVEVCSTCTVGTPYKGKGLSARANRIGKCFLMKTSEINRSLMRIFSHHGRTKV